MNKKIVPFLLASSMLLQTSITSFAAELNNSQTEKTNITVGAESADSQTQTEKSVSDTESTSETEKASDKKDTDTTSSSDISKQDKASGKENVSEEKKVDSEADAFVKTNPVVKRIAGNNRVNTSIEISKFEAVKADKVILADASNYPDALSASTLTSGKYPVLLIQNKLTPELRGEMQRLSAKEVIILGGEKSIPKKVESEVKEIAGVKTVNRISGSDRYSTSNEIYKNSGKNQVVVSSGENFPDALAASSLINTSGLILTKKNSIPASVLNTINSAQGRISVIGGQGSISEGFYKQLSPNAKYETISGSDRYSTSVEIAKKLTSDVAIIASGENFPDALAASTLSQKINSPILLVSKNNIPYSVQKYIIDKQVKKAIVLGGEGTISAQTVDNVQRIIENKTIISQEAPKLNTSDTEKKVENKISNIKKDAVTKNKVTLYSDSDLSQAKTELPKNKIVDVLEQNENSIKVRYDKKEGWVSREQLKEYNVTSFGKVVNHVPYYSQLYPVYAPNGCEATSMYMGLKAKGYVNIGLRAYLDKMPKTSSNPKYGYVGVPYNVEQGRFQTIDPEPLAKYGRVYGNVVNIQGESMENIIKEIQNGNTVVLYGTLFWNRPYFRTLKVEGKPMRRIWNNHVFLLTGYDPVKKMFYIADPYNHEKAGASRTRPFYYWKSLSAVSTAYNYDNRKFAVAIR